MAWDLEHDERIKEMWCAGATVEEIAADLQQRALAALKRPTLRQQADIILRFTGEKIRARVRYLRSKNADLPGRKPGPRGRTEEEIRLLNEA